MSLIKDAMQAFFCGSFCYINFDNHLKEISSLYENREDIVVGQTINMTPLSERLLWPYRALTAD